jgi:ketosteroid isomerase-like protein
MGDFEMRTDNAANKEIVTKFLEGFWTGEPEKSLALCSDDAVWTFQKSLRSPRYASVPNALDWLNKTLVSGFDRDSGYKIVVHNVVSDGEEAAIEYTATGTTIRGELYENNYLVRFTVRESEIISVRPYFDTHYVNERLSELPLLDPDF